MIVVSELAKRYAGALFEAVAEKAQYTAVLEQLRALEKAINSNEDVRAFMTSSLIKGEEKAKAIAETFKTVQALEPVKNLAVLLANNDRLDELSAIVQAYQAKTDEAHGVVRGTVRSAAALAPEQRQSVEAQVAHVTGKKVIMEYKQDESLIGGLVAEVGSLTFDDSLDTQLRLLNEELKRRAH